MQVTIKEVAKRAGVSATTVSLVLQPDSRISDSTKEKVFKAIKELNYTPNLSAKNLRYGENNSIGFIVTDIASPFYAVMLNVATEYACRHGFNLLFSSSGWDEKIEANAVEQMLQARVKGIIACLCEVPGMPILKRLEMARIPAILLDTYPDGYSGPFVANDLYQAGYSATESMIKAGAERLIFFSGPENNVKFSSFRKIGQGFMEAHKKYKLPTRASIVNAGLTIQAGLNAFNTILAQKSVPNGILCVNDLCAYGVMEGILNTGLLPGHDIAVTGIDNLETSSLETISLSSVQLPYSELVETAMSSLIESINEKKMPDIRTTIKPEMINRNSTNLKVEKK